MVVRSEKFRLPSGFTPHPSLAVRRTMFRSSQNEKPGATSTTARMHSTAPTEPSAVVKNVRSSTKVITSTVPVVRVSVPITPANLAQNFRSLDMSVTPAIS